MITVKYGSKLHSREPNMNAANRVFLALSLGYRRFVTRTSDIEHDPAWNVRAAIEESSMAVHLLTRCMLLIRLQFAVALASKA